MRNRSLRTALYDIGGNVQPVIVPYLTEVRRETRTQQTGRFDRKSRVVFAFSGKSGVQFAVDTESDFDRFFDVADGNFQVRSEFAFEFVRAYLVDEDAVFYTAPESLRTRQCSSCS